MGDENVYGCGDTKIMSSNLLILAEMAITLIAVIGWGLWELYKLRKLKKEK